MNTADFERIREHYIEALPAYRESYPKYDPYFGGIDWIPYFSPAEYAAWESIRMIGLPFLPQFPERRFFLDFADPMIKLNIEIDGRAYHDKDKDAKRDKELASIGWRTIRVPASDTVVKSHPTEYDVWYGSLFDELLAELKNIVYIREVPKEVVIDYGVAQVIEGDMLRTRRQLLEDYLVAKKILS